MLFQRLPFSEVLGRNGSSISVVLLENMEKRGIVGDIIEVKRGFARNFLIPRKKAGDDLPSSVCQFISYLTSSLLVYATTFNKVKFGNKGMGSSLPVAEKNAVVVEEEILSFERF